MSPASVRRLLVNIDEGCRALSIGRTTFYGLIRNGDLEVVKIGRRTLVVYSSLERYVDALSCSEEGSE